MNSYIFKRNHILTITLAIILFFILPSIQHANAGGGGGEDDGGGGGGNNGKYTSVRDMFDGGGPGKSRTKSKTNGSKSGRSGFFGGYTGLRDMFDGGGPGKSRDNSDKPSFASLPQRDSTDDEDTYFEDSSQKNRDKFTLQATKAKINIEDKEITYFGNLFWDKSRINHIYYDTLGADSNLVKEKTTSNYLLVDYSCDGSFDFTKQFLLTVSSAQTPIAITTDIPVKGDHCFSFKTTDVLAQTKDEASRQLAWKKFSIDINVAKPNVGEISTECPMYNKPICQATEKLVGGIIQSNGCVSAPKCVKNVAKPNVGEISTECPMYNKPICQATEKLVGGIIQSNGCVSAPKCVKKDTSGILNDDFMFEVKVYHESINPGSDTLIKTTKKDWTYSDITIQKDEQLLFRWDAQKYDKCLINLHPVKYNFSSGVTSVSGNTEFSKTDVRELTGIYKIECTTGDVVHSKKINVVVQ